MKLTGFVAVISLLVLAGCATGENPRWEYRTFATVQGLNEHSAEGWVVVNEVARPDGGHEFLVKRRVETWNYKPHSTSMLPPPHKAPTTAKLLLIVSAVYGSGTHFADVTYRVNDLLRDPDVEFFAQPGWLNADPTPGWNKALVVVYEVDGQRRVFTTGEGGSVTLGKLLHPQKKPRRAKGRK